MPFCVDPLPYRTLREMVASNLRDAILSGAMRPGQRIMETEIASKMEISRATLRDALRLLEKEGLVRTVPQRGASVIDLSRDDLTELHDLRGILEGHAAARACEHVTPAEAERMRLLCQEMSALIPVSTPERRSDFIGKDAEYHELLVAAARSPHLTEILSSIGMRIRLIMRTIGREGLGLEQAAAEHERMLVPILGNDPAEAERLAREHVRGAKERFLSMLS